MSHFLKKRKTIFVDFVQRTSKDSLAFKIPGVFTSFLYLQTANLYLASTLEKEFGLNTRVNTIRFKTT